MSIDIPSDLIPYVQSLVSSGRCESETQVVSEALRLLRETDERRQQIQKAVLEGVQSGDSISEDVVFDRLDRILRQSQTGSA
jgi:putative addiction module CopG family antidote